MRYIGGKTKILPYLERFLLDKLSPNNSNSLSFLDLFAGTGAVAGHFKPRFQVMTNDSLYFSYLLSKGSIVPNTPPSFSALYANGVAEPLDYLNAMRGTEGFITKNYASDTSDGRMYFTLDNAKKIDAIRLQLNDWRSRNWVTQDEFEYLLATLIEAVPFISNTTGTYGAYLKHWDKRALKKLSLIHPILYDNQQQNVAYNQNAENLTQSLTADICYVDPPYNGRQYTSNYHVLETIAKYDDPDIKGVTGMRPFNKDESSDFCRKTKVLPAFEKIISQVDCEHLIISYSSDGLLSRDQIQDLLMAYGIAQSFDFKVIDYQTYKSKIVLKPKVDEYLFYIKKAK